ncbi:MAG: DUF4388 domain-containing protein, partial [Candidatus Electryoneaceae bacterium]|nr:DUF4388 domain-containing protein [Candidatus Electryoneaceae bacterium]
MSSSGRFGGTIKAVSLPDTIRLMCDSGRTVALMVSVGQKQGTMFFQDGEIVHAVQNDLEGEEAFLSIISWKGGEFSLRALAQKREKTIFESWEGLLLESARRNDEAKMEASKKMSSDQEANQSTQSASNTPKTKTAETVRPSEARNVDPNSSEVINPFATGVKSDDVPPELFDFERYEIPISSDSPSETPVEPMDLSTSSDKVGNVSDLPNDPLMQIPDDPAPLEKSDVLEAPDQESPAESVHPTEQHPKLDGLPPSAVASPIPSDQPRDMTESDSLSFNDEMINQALNQIIQHYSKSWPDNTDMVRFDSINPDLFSERIYNHFLCRFLQLAMQVIRLDDMPFDFSNTELNKALKDIYEKLRNNWLISHDQFQQIIFEANHFDIYRSIDPATAISQFLDRRTSGNVVQMRPLIQTLIQHGLIEEYYIDLLTHIEDMSETIDPRKTASFIQTILYKKSEKQSYQAVRQAMQ